MQPEIQTFPTLNNISKTNVAGVAELSRELPKYGVCTAVQCGGDQCHHQLCSMDSLSNTNTYCSYRPALPSYTEYYSALQGSKGAEIEDGGFTVGAFDHTVNEEQGEDQCEYLPPQSDLPCRCRYLQLTAVSTNPNNGMPMTSGVRAGGGCEGTGGGEACVAVGSQGYYTV